MIRAMRRKRAWLAVALIVLVALLGALGWMASDYRLWVRFANWPQSADDPANARRFSPQAPIVYGDSPAPDTAQDLVIPQDVLEEAWDYAQSQQSYALLVSVNGELQFERYDRGANSRTPYNSQSLHKSLTAVMLGAAIYNGAIESEDQPASFWLEEWAGDPQRSGITLANLAYMEGGLERGRFAVSPFAPGARLFLTGHLAREALGTPMAAEPGAEYIWSNASVQALSIAIERAAGRPWAQLLRDWIWEPLGAGEAWVQLDRPGGNAQSFCCLISNGRNWLRIGELLAGDGVWQGRRLLPEGWVDRMTRGASTNPNFGMQLWRNEPYSPTQLRMSKPRLEVPRDPALAAPDAWYMEGHFSQRVYVVPSLGLVVVRFGKDRLDWDEAKLMNGMIGALKPASTVSLSVAIPDHAFGERAAPRAPDYERRDNWARYPDGEETLAAEHAAGFYIHPTTWPGSEWNATVPDAAARPEVDAVVASQASVLDACCAVYAPRYRQAASAAVFDQRGNRDPAYGLAFTDIVRAFTHFAERTGDRPIVLLGHSQGALHAERLLSDVIAGDDALRKRMAVTYIAGIPVPLGSYEDRLESFEPCRKSDDTGCVASWVTFGPTGDARAAEFATAQRFPQYQREDGGLDVQCSNPLNWPAPGEWTPASANRGAVAPSLPGQGRRASIPGVTGAWCDRGILRLDRTPAAPFDALMLPGASYHYYDVALFHAALSVNASLRAQSWRQTQQQKSQ
ncbi:MAG: DUF3089 domain-containing protein [Gammaproteobacteria bacterium]|nr:DUF3089 domain-containing protein [Gammaproteobacteria bacterium]MYD03296.1 DUF3089 domain-containing protein [Gammaproteobacteria bacterium]MYI24168.1 DUF3089 domain-containing protein [Gammaproteobacteria bacterium]